MAFQTQPLFEDAITNGSLSALDSTLELVLNNASGAIINVSGTWIGTILLEGSNDNFITFQNAALFTPPAGVITTGIVSNGYYRLVAVSGFTRLRARMSSYTSGLAAIVISASIGAGLAPTISVNYDSMLGTSKITGATDLTKIGNNGDKLKVDASFVGNAIANSLAFTSKTRVVILTTSVLLVTGSYTNVYSYSGTGLLYGFNIEFNNINVIVRLQIDGEIIFDGVTIATLNGLLGTGNDIARRQAGTGIVTSSSTIDWSLKQPIKYNNNVTISADANGGVLFSRNFSQGIIYISKET